MNGEPLDLRSLAEVDEPDVVKAALRTFRRRILTRYVWITLVIGLVLAAVLWGLQPTTLEQRVQSATRVDEPQYVWHVASLGIGLVRVAKLGDDVGMQFVVVPRGSGQAADGFELSVTGSIETELASDGFMAYVEVPRTADGQYTVTVQQNSFRAPRKSFVVSLPDLGVDQGTWKEEADA
jgi:hypothetical protein